MNNLVFTALCLALLYYLFYRPSPKSNANPSFKHQETQTEVDENPEIIKQLKEDNHQKEITIISLNNSYEKLESEKVKEIHRITELSKASEQQIKALNKQLEELKKTQQADEKVFSQLKKEMEELTQQLN